MNSELQSYFGTTLAQLVILLTILVACGMGIATFAETTEQEVVSIEGPIEEELDSATPYEELSSEEKRIFRSEQSGIHDTSDSVIVAEDTSQFTGTSAIMLDGMYYKVSQEVTTQSVHEYSSLITTTLFVMFLLTLLLFLVVGKEFVVISLSHIETSTSFSVDGAILALIILTVASAFVFGTVISDETKNSVELVESPDESADVVQYTELSSESQDDFLDTLSSEDGFVKDTPLSTYDGEYIKSDGEYYRVESVETLKTNSRLGIALALFTGLVSAAVGVDIGSSVNRNIESGSSIYKYELE